MGLKIISGDNPVTVSSIAQKGWTRTITICRFVQNHGWGDYHGWRDSYFHYMFPYQERKSLSKLWKKQGIQQQWQGMVSMISSSPQIVLSLWLKGDTTTRQIANLVLLNSDFNDVPEILFWGASCSQPCQPISHQFSWVRPSIPSCLQSSVSPVFFWDGLVDLIFTHVPIQFKWLTSSWKVSHH